jgi:tetratricopeptide (TPR) repeat protein
MRGILLYSFIGVSVASTKKAADKMRLDIADKHYKYKALIGAYWSVPRKALLVVNNAIKNRPRSAELWDMRGDIIGMLLFSENKNRIVLASGDKYTYTDVLRSYRKAIKIDPTFATAYESIGYYHDVVTNCRNYAKSAFRKAIMYGAGINSYYGLARVLAQQNHDIEALTLLKRCPFAKDYDIVTLKSEILEGQWRV